MLLVFKRFLYVFEMFFLRGCADLHKFVFVLAVSKILINRPSISNRRNTRFAKGNNGGIYAFAFEATCKFQASPILISIEFFAIFFY